MTKIIYNEDKRSFFKPVNRLKQARLALGLKQHELAYYCNQIEEYGGGSMSAPYISALENDKHKPNWETKMRICEALKSVSYKNPDISPELFNINNLFDL